MRHIALALMLFFTIALPAAELSVDPAQQELHGTFAGQPFWLRLLPADKQFANNRVLQLVYTPPSETELVGARISDCPFLLVNPHLLIVALNGRESGSKVVPANPKGYAVTREITVADGDDKLIDLEHRTITGELGWDLRLAPILLSLGWHSDTSAEIRLVDLFGPRHAEKLTLKWNHTAVTIADTTYTISPDKSGNLQTITTADGTILLTVTGRP
jgi:hypothetical protein